MAGLRAERFKTFIEWAAKHITGDEKGQAQIFLDRLFQAFGQDGCLDVGGTAECRIRKSQEDGGGTAFADYVWKPMVLIEMKRRGEDLSRHFRQAFDYWTRLVPGRPRYVILCNFDEFWIYDFESQMDSPVDMVRIEDLATRFGPLAFLFPTPERPVFGNDHEAVTRDAADRLSTCFKKLAQRKDVNRDTARRFILQMLVALFAEDIGLLDQYLVVQLLEECKSPKDSYDLLGGLFTAMNTPGGMSGGRFKGVEYFNGGLFTAPARLELHDDELNQLKQAANADWSKVQPEIFGTLFQHSMETDERRAFGAHFTSPVDIMKIVSPTIVEPWRQLIEDAKTIKRLAELRQRLERLRVLDPACGSGNFLYIAYREMKRLEARIFERMSELSARGDTGQKVFGFVTAAQFFGIDINPFAVELAKVTMMIARKLAIDELHVNEQALPLGNLDKNFLAADALIDAEGCPTKWPPADVIIGNPPFLGAKRLKPERGASYVNAVRKAYPKVPRMADYCVYWLRKAHDHLPDCTADDPVIGRAGLVGTQNIRNNKSRVGGLDYIVKSGAIIEAVDNQPWSGEADVHVSIANWVKRPPIDPKLTKREQAVVNDQLLISSERKLWFKVDLDRDKTRIRKKGSGPAAKDYELAFRLASFINSSLSDKTDVSVAKVLKCNTEPQVCFQGFITGYKGFILEPHEAKAIISRDPASADVIHPFLIGRDLVSGDGSPSRFVIDLSGHTLLSAQEYPGALAHLERHVLPKVKAKTSTTTDSVVKARKEHLERWWEMWCPRSGMMEAIMGLRRYCVCSDTTKRPIFQFVDTSIWPDHKVRVFAFQDDYSFGMLQSHPHWLWFVTKCSKLTERFNYTSRTVFDTFPWPQTPNTKQIDAVAKAGREVRSVRNLGLTKNKKGGLRAVYRTLELPGKNPLKDAHLALDAAVLDAYGFSPRKDLLAQLLELNQAVAARIEADETATAPGIPKDYPDRAKLLTDDCVQPTT